MLRDQHFVAIFLEPVEEGGATVIVGDKRARQVHAEPDLGAPIPSMGRLDPSMAFGLDRTRSETHPRKLTSRFVRKSKIHISTSCGSIPFVELAVDCKTAVFVASHASGPTLRELIFALNDLSLCGGNVGRESEQEVVGNPLLHRDAGARIGVVAA